jgi:hypothetical protein
MRPGIMEENHIVHENPWALFPNGSSQTCCSAVVPRSTGRILQQWHLQTSGAMGQMPEPGWWLCGKIVKGA